MLSGNFLSILSCGLLALHATARSLPGSDSRTSNTLRSVDFDSDESRHNFDKRAITESMNSAVKLVPIPSDVFESSSVEKRAVGDSPHQCLDLQDQVRMYYAGMICK